MPNKRIRDEWDPIIRQMKADNPKWSAEKIQAGLVKEYPGEDVPSKKTVTRSLAEDYDHLPYQRFTWPASMENGAFPWEASNCLLELFVWLRYLLGEERPTIEESRWYYRVTKASPSSPIGLRWDLAKAFAEHRLAGKPFPKSMEWAVMMAAWNRDGKREDDEYRRSLEGRRKDTGWRTPLDISPEELGDRKVPPLHGLIALVEAALRDGWPDTTAWVPPAPPTPQGPEEREFARIAAQEIMPLLPADPDGQKPSVQLHGGDGHWTVELLYLDGRRRRFEGVTTAEATGRLLEAMKEESND